MPDDLDTARDPLRLVRANIVLVVALMILGGVVGCLVATTHQTRTTAEARLAVGSSGLRAFQVPGFALAAQQSAANYARFVNGSSTTQSALSSALGSRVSTLTDVAASPITDSNVVRVEVTGTSRSAAVTAADAVASALIARSGPSTPSATTLLARYKRLALAAAAANRRSTNATPPNQVAAQAALVTAELQRDVAGVAYQSALTQGSYQTRLEFIQKAAVTDNDRARTLQLYGVSGVLLGLVAGLVIAALRRPRAAGGAFESGAVESEPSSTWQRLWRRRSPEQGSHDDPELIDAESPARPPAPVRPPRP